MASDGLAHTTKAPFRRRRPREGARAELDAILVEHLIRALEGLTQKLQGASTASAKTPRALLFWTKVLVIVTAVNALFTGLSVFQRR
jgi:hypothetical protein